MRLAAGLMVLGAFAPLSEPLDKILLLVGAVLILVCNGTIEWEDRRKRQADQSSSAA